MKGLISLIFLVSTLFASNNRWSSHSAYIVEKGRWELGLFQPLRYGYTNTSEFSIYPGWFFLMPNIEIKESQMSVWGFTTASQYRLIYPTPLLNVLSRKGIGGVIAPEHKIPTMFSFTGTLIGSKKIGRFDLTLSGGLDIGIVLGELNPLSTIDLPLVYHRLGVFYNGWGMHSGFDIQTAISRRIEVLLDSDILFLPGLDGEYSLENKFLISWNKSNNFRIMMGYKVVLGEFPYGEDIRILPYLPVLERWVPILELQWGRDKK